MGQFEKLLLEFSHELILSDEQARNFISVDEKRIIFFMSELSAPCYSFLNNLINPRGYNGTRSLKEYMESLGIFSGVCDSYTCRVFAGEQKARSVPMVISFKNNQKINFFVPSNYIRRQLQKTPADNMELFANFLYSSFGK